MVAAGSVLSACAEDEPTGFTADNRSGFLAACTQPLEDTRLVSAICQCVFDETQVKIPFSRFATTDATLQELPERPLPPEITGIIADCVIEEADL